MVLLVAVEALKNDSRSDIEIEENLIKCQRRQIEINDWFRMASLIAHNFDINSTYNSQFNCPWPHFRRVRIRWFRLIDWLINRISLACWVISYVRVDLWVLHTLLWALFEEILLMEKQAISFYHTFFFWLFCCRVLQWSGITIRVKVERKGNRDITVKSKETK